MFGKLEELGNEVAQKIGTALDPQAYAEYGAPKPQAENRFGSFAPPRQGNEVKWHVDGCAYFYAVSKALENAKEYIWILDCTYSRWKSEFAGWKADTTTRVALARTLPETPPGEE